MRPECSVLDCTKPHTGLSYCRSHYRKFKYSGDPFGKTKKYKTLDERFWEYVEIGNKKECWLWTGHKLNNGYGQIKGNPPAHKRHLAHRIAYTFIRGEIPHDKVIDHLCKNKSCVNPYHMELVSHVENVMRGNSPHARNARKTHCPSGHPYSGDNLRIDKNGWRRCAKCKWLEYNG